MTNDHPAARHRKPLKMRVAQVVCVGVVLTTEGAYRCHLIGVVVGKGCDGLAGASHLRAKSLAHWAQVTQSPDTCSVAAPVCKLTRIEWRHDQARPMIRRRARTEAAQRPRPARHARHGRAGRSPVVRPPLPPLESRADRFEIAVGSAAEYLRTAWPELRDVRFEIAGMPAAAIADGIPRWSVLSEEKRIILYRLPIERLSRLHRVDELHRRIMVESCVFRAAAEYLGREPWDLGPEHRH